MKEKYIEMTTKDSVWKSGFLHGAEQTRRSTEKDEDNFVGLAAAAERWNAPDKY